jgi:hypothetical protein
MKENKELRNEEEDGLSKLDYVQSRAVMVKCIIASYLVFAQHEIRAQTGLPVDAFSTCRLIHVS